MTLALERLEVSFKWEVRTLWTVPIGVVVFFINRPAGHIFGALGALSTLVMDTLFSVIVIATFLRPINKVLHRNQHPPPSPSSFSPLPHDQVPDVEDGANKHDAARPDAARPDAARSDAALRMVESAKWATLAGTSIAVLSSSLLYLNGLLLMVFPVTFGQSALLNPLTCMVSADSVLNGFGVLLVSGLLTPSCRKSSSIYHYSSSSDAHHPQTPSVASIVLASVPVPVPSEGSHSSSEEKGVAS
jgi:hypothetical protein